MGIQLKDEAYKRIQSIKLPYLRKRMPLKKDGSSKETHLQEEVLGNEGDRIEWIKVASFLAKEKKKGPKKPFQYKEESTFPIGDGWSSSGTKDSIKRLTHSKYSYNIRKVL